VGVGSGSDDELLQVLLDAGSHQRPHRQRHRLAHQPQALQLLAAAETKSGSCWGGPPRAASWRHSDLHSAAARLAARDSSAPPGPSFAGGSAAPSYVQGGAVPLRRGEETWRHAMAPPPEEAEIIEAKPLISPSLLATVRRLRLLEADPNQPLPGGRTSSSSGWLPAYVDAKNGQQ
jgi:hypothetical protein